mgnify:CR=1 FL=1
MGKGHGQGFHKRAMLPQTSNGNEPIRLKIPVVGLDLQAAIQLVQGICEPPDQQEQVSAVMVIRSRAGAVFTCALQTFESLFEALECSQSPGLFVPQASGIEFPVHARLYDR